MPVSADAYAGRPVLRFPRRRQAPVFVDSPGVAVRVTSEYREPSYRLLHWETIGEVVVRPDTLAAVEDVGLRLRADPHEVAHRVRVAGWGYRRIPLELAVARFSGHRVDVVGEAPPPAAAERPASPAGPVFAWWREPDRRSWRPAPRTLVLRIDARGIRFGPGPGSDPPVRWFPWSEVDQVVIFSVALVGGSAAAVGVMTRPDVPGGGEPRIAAYRLAVGWVPGDRLRLALWTHAPQVLLRYLDRVPRHQLPH